MKILIFEDNLIWSARLVQSLRALGHEAEVVSPKRPTGDGEQAPPPNPPPQAQTFRGGGAPGAAIVNLGSPGIKELVEGLRASGIYVIGHAGHKEKDLHALGKEAGCDRLATNGELTWKVAELIPKG